MITVSILMIFIDLVVRCLSCQLIRSVPLQLFMARSVTPPRVRHQKTCISAISAVPYRQKFALISAWLHSTFQKSRVQTYIIPLNFTFLTTSHLKICSAAITIQVHLYPKHHLRDCQHLPPRRPPFGRVI